MKDILLQAIASSSSMGSAAKSIGLPYETFKRRCKENGVEMKTNQGGKGLKKPISRPIELLRDRNSIKKRLLAEGVPNICDECKIPPIWNGKPLVFQLEHHDGNAKNNARENLRLLCPNCHTQTPTWGAKKRIADVV